MSPVRDVFVSVQYSGFRLNNSIYHFYKTSLFEVKLMNEEIAILIFNDILIFLARRSWTAQQDCKLYSFSWKKCAESLTLILTDMFYHTIYIEIKEREMMTGFL